MAASPPPVPSPQAAPDAAVHDLLRRQLEAHGGAPGRPPADWEGFLAAVAAAYRRFEAECGDQNELLARHFASEQMLRKVLDNIPQRVFWKDRDCVYLGCNRALALDCGAAGPEEMVGRTDHQTKAAELAELYREDDRRVMERNEPKLNYEEPHIKPDGQPGWLITNKVPLHDPEGRVIGVLGTYEDITERKRLEEQLRRAQKMDAFGRLAGGVAHDFNNLLTVIIASLDALAWNGLPEAQRAPALADCQCAARRAADLTAQLLTFSRRRPAHMEPLDLNEVVASATRLLRRVIGEDIALETRRAPRPAPVRADSSLLEQALMNLALNARDAMPQGGRLTVGVDLIERGAGGGCPARPGAYVRVRVSDTGTGIAPEHLPHIFEPFFTTKDVGRGTGLGLATVFGIVEQHGGWVEVASEPGRGSTFGIHLPAAAAVPAAGEAPPAAGPPPGGRETVLVVEDEPAVRQIIRQILERAGYRVHAADCARSARALWRGPAADAQLLLTDMVMPGGVSGQDLAAELRRERPGLKVLLCSGYAEPRPGGAPFPRDRRHFLEKPFEPGELLRRVRGCLDEPGSPA